MKKNTLILIITLLACVLVFCVFMLVRSYKNETEGEVIYEEAMEDFLITIPAAMEATTQPPTTAPTQPGDTAPATEAPTEATETATQPAVTRPVIKNAEEVQVDFAKLQQVNSDILGWIIIENTTVSYPILQGEDNDYYLNMTYNNKKSSYGSIFVDYRLPTSFKITHTVIYGHNMRNSSMFGQLLKYSNRSFWQDRKYFHVLLPDGTLKYEIFSAYKAQVDSETYRVRFDDDAAKQTWLDTVIGWSDVQMGVQPGVDDQFVTLSTCTSTSSEKEGYRYVVHGRKVMDTRPGMTAEPTTEPVTEATTEPVTEAATEPATEASTEPVTEAATEPVTEATTEPGTEASTEATATTQAAQ